MNQEQTSPVEPSGDSAFSLFPCSYSIPNSPAGTSTNFREHNLKADCSHIRAESRTGGQMSSMGSKAAERWCLNGLSVPHLNKALKMPLTPGGSGDPQPTAVLLLLQL